MKYSGIVKFLVSVPVIVLCLYFIPILGILLMIVRMVVYYNKKVIDIPIVCAIIGVILCIPSLINYITNKLGYNHIESLDIIVNNDVFKDISSRSNFLIITGIVFMVVSYLFIKISKRVSTKALSYLSDYINESEKKDMEVREKTEMKMAEKREAAKHTHVLKCPKCGYSNMFVGNNTRCVHCRTVLEWKE